MGEHRINLKIEFEMHGLKDKWDAWLNWSDNIPQRVAEWIEDRKEKAIQKYWNEDTEYQEKLTKEKREREEASERADYERLKAKFE